ncbi:MAG: DUF2589 domain-containing protein [Acetobacteraceae bacterium]
MADGVTLHDLIEAIAGAVIGAQDKVERYQISNIRRFFDDNNRPVGVEVRMPKLGGADGEEVSIRVPLLALVGATRLSIKDVEISMDIEIGELTTAPTESAPSGQPAAPPPGQDQGAQASGWERPATQKVVVLDVHAPRSRERPATAKVVLRVESHDPPEGVARLMIELNKRIGIPIGGSDRSTQAGGDEGPPAPGGVSTKQN